ncbi:MAG: aminotransferase class IV [Alphaproteobacteria bacterium]
MAYAYYDGRFVERSAVGIDPADFGFSRGIVISDVIRVYDGTPFHLDDHLDRLALGAGIVSVVPPDDAEALLQIIPELVAKNGFSHSVVKVYLTGGECMQPDILSFAACRAFTPHLLIVEDDFEPRHPEAPYGLEAYQRGQRLKVVPFARELPMVKSANYMLGFYAARKHVRDCDDVIFTHPDGYVTQPTHSNFFCVIDGVLMTPARGMLRGVTRKVILSLAERHGIPARECDLFPADLARATECFKTGSTVEMVPVRQIDDHILPTTMEGPVFRQLRRAFTDYVNEYSGRVAQAA